jgi:hypothetical protein
MNFITAGFSASIQPSKSAMEDGRSNWEVTQSLPFIDKHVNWGKMILLRIVSSVFRL